LERSINTKKLDFSGVEVPFPKNIISKDLDEIKHLFKMTMT